jgi:hypothetical protein
MTSSRVISGTRNKFLNNALLLLKNSKKWRKIELFNHPVDNPNESLQFQS